MSPATTAPDDSDMTEDVISNAPPQGKNDSDHASLVDMRLSIGDALQLDCGAPIGTKKAYVKLVGYLKDRSIIVTAPTLGGRKLELIENDSVLVRGFSGMNAYAFRAFVMRVGRMPFDYVHLSFPTAVFGRAVRRSQRVRTELPAQAVGNGPKLSEPLPVLIEDLSALGALISSAHEFDAEHPLRLNIGLLIHGNRVEVEAEGGIVSYRAEAASDTKPQSHRYGLEFKDVDPHNAMLIKAYVYQQIVDCQSALR